MKYIRWVIGQSFKILDNIGAPNATRYSFHHLKLLFASYESTFLHIHGSPDHLISPAFLEAVYLDPVSLDPVYPHILFLQYSDFITYGSLQIEPLDYGILHTCSFSAEDPSCYGPLI